MANRRTLIFVSLTLVLIAAAASRVVAKNYYIVRGPDGNLVRTQGPAEEWERWNDSEYDCRNGACVLCGQCHLKAAPLVGKRFIPTVHAAAYAKVSVRLTPGQRVSWTPDTFLRLEEGKICMFNTRNVKLLCYDASSILIKDKSGQPAFVSWTRPPTLFALKPAR